MSDLKKAVNQRFMEVLDHLKAAKKINGASLAVKTGLAVSNITFIKKGAMAPPDVMLNYLEKHFEVNKEYILSGKKPMFKEKASYLEKRRDQKLNGVQEGIPIYEDAPFTLTNTESYRDVDIDKPDFWITIPGLRKCNYGCRASGDSMHPLIRNHALVVGEEITDLSFILFGEVYIVITKNGTETVKYIHPNETEKDELLLVPFNKRATTTPIHKSEILKLYRAKAVFNVL